MGEKKGELEAVLELSKDHGNNFLFMYLTNFATQCHVEYACHLTDGRLQSSKFTINSHFCCNLSGADRLPIGMSAKPHCFASNGVNRSSLPMVWRSNKKDWMNSEIFQEWLFLFYACMEGRKVALLIGSFSVHKSGLEIVVIVSRLQNVEVIFLPVNATSFCQPLDQGIIRSWKAHYRRRWVQYMVDEHTHDHDPNKTMDVLHMTLWKNAVWIEDVTEITIANCWLQARELGPDYYPLTEAQAKEHEKNKYQEVVSQVCFDV